MRLLVTGDRNWGRVPTDSVRPEHIRRAKAEREYLELVLDTILQTPGITHLIVGDAKGVDEFAKRWAQDRGVAFALNMDDKPAPFVADWDTHGKKAGPLRNLDMLYKGNPDAVVAFHRDFMRSKGTRHMVEASLAQGLMVSIHPTVSPVRDS